jgi:hypothetical protein
MNQGQKQKSEFLSKANFKGREKTDLEKEEHYL